jgi:16S rRNA (cytosine967-C5)-methyltransferase
MIWRMNHDPRLLAAQILSTWTHIHDPPRIESRDSLEWQALTPRNRALAFDLICGIIRRRLTLDAMIHAVSKTPLDNIQPDVLAVLRMGAYQLVIAQGIADHAAIDTSVELVRTLGAVRATSFVNAVLRNIQRLGAVIEPLQSADVMAFPLDSRRQVKFNRAIFPDPKRQFIDYLAITTSHPRELVTAMISWIGADKARDVLISNNISPAVTLRCDQLGFHAPPEAGLIPHQSPYFFVAADGWNSSIESLVAGGRLSPQDPTAARAVRALAAELQDHCPKSQVPRILDLCAGLGTKTIQLARALPHAQITACDIADDKLAAIERRASQVGVTNIRIMDMLTFRAHQPPPFDAVLVDAPCSNTGVLARRLQVRWRWPLFELADVRELQIRLMNDAAEYLKPDGLLAYSTCSIDPAENDGAVEDFVRARPHEQWMAMRREFQLPTAGEADRRCDGGFVTVFKRQRA